MAIEQLIEDGYSAELAQAQIREYQIAAKVSGLPLIVGNWKDDDHLRTIMRLQAPNPRFEEWLADEPVGGFVKLAMIDVDSRISFETFPYVEFPSA